MKARTRSCAGRWRSGRQAASAGLRGTERLAGIPPVDWRGEDVTAAYTAARREVFETCRRITVTARPGEAYLAHRLSLHGVAPWADDAGSEGMRMIAYFRPDPFPGASPAWWLARP